MIHLLAGMSVQYVSGFLPLTYLTIVNMPTAGVYQWIGVTLARHGLANHIQGLVYQDDNMDAFACWLALHSLRGLRPLGIFPSCHWGQGGTYPGGTLRLH